VSTASVSGPHDIRVIHSSRGRLRVHVPRWSGRGERLIVHRLVQLRGVHAAQASRLTRNILLHYDHRTITEAILLHALQGLPFEMRAAAPPRADLPPATTEGNGKEQRARIAVRGLDRNAGIATRAVQLLRQRGVRATVRPLTGHIIVEYDEYKHVLKELVALVARVELPGMPGEDRPAHPLDPMPFWQSLARAIGSLAGLGIITYRRLATPVASPIAPGHGTVSTLAGVVNLVHGLPFMRRRLNRWLGSDRAQLGLDALSIITLTAANFPLGLVVTGLDALLLLGEVMARRAAWRRYEENLEGAVSAEPGGVVRLEAGARVPLAADVIEGTGTAISPSSLPLAISPGSVIPAGALLSGGPFVLQLHGGATYEAAPRQVPPAPTYFDRYIRRGGWLAWAYLGVTAVRTLSPIRIFEALLLLNPRTAVIGHATSNTAAAARVLRSGLTVVGTRPERHVQLPGWLLLDGPRLLCDGLELVEVRTPSPAVLASEVLAVAAIVSAAASSPWGNVFGKAGHAIVSGGEFNGLWATATVDGVQYALGPPEDLEHVPEDFLTQHAGGYILDLRNDAESTSFGLIALQPKLAAGTEPLVAMCKRLGVEAELVWRGGTATAGLIARRAGISLNAGMELVDAIRRRQRQGAIVAVVSDHADAAAAFAACDAAIGLASARTGEFPARADLLVPDLRGVVDFLDAAGRRQQAIRDSVHLSTAANVIGIIQGLLPNQLGAERASFGVYLACLAAMGATVFRLRGGHRPESSLAHLADPRPERWARRRLDEVLRALDTTADGLSGNTAAARRQTRGGANTGDQLLLAIRNQLKAPITMVLGGGACLTLVLAQPLNTALLAITTSLNIAAGVWQEREVGKAAEAIKRLSAGTARVLRDGQSTVVGSDDVVPGDVLVLGPGDRVPADARILEAHGMEVNEAALTGESLPVPKGPDEFADVGRILLEGSDIVVGHGRAVVVAVGRQTRLGATAAALNVGRAEHSAMAQRLSRILQIALPASAAGGALAGIAGLFYGGTLAGQLAVGVTTALSAIPEGLPLLAGVGQAGVANRLASKNALVRRIAAVEALGRVDVACTDKTGTMTEGRLAVRLVADLEHEVGLPGTLPVHLTSLVLTAALASPHPDARDGLAHPTDRAVVRAALGAGLGEQVRAPRLAEMQFDSARAFHASLVPGRLCVKGAPERLMPRCDRVRIGGIDEPLTEARRTAVLARVTMLAERGLRVLLVAEGPPDCLADNPQGLTALGFVAISDPLRASVPDAVRRCQAAGIRVIMLTGDHPATARAIAGEAGLLVCGASDVMRAADLEDLTPADLDQCLASVAVIARAAPLDKLRVIQSLRRRGHIVAMTGDGVNDAPALRLADVGVAMGQSGTEVARQASDVVLTDDDFATLVEALVEGRGFWRNMRTALGLLLGGNAGELGVIVGATLMGFGPPLSTVQILLVNLITDALPALAVVLQRPHERVLAALAREGLSALDSGLRRDVLRRGLATSIPTLGSYLLMQALAGPQQASAVAFGSVVATQLAQTLDAGRVQGFISRSVLQAVGASAVALGSAMTIPPLRDFLGLVTPSPLGWVVIGGAAICAVVMSRAISELSRAPGTALLRPETPPAWLAALQNSLRRLEPPGLSPGVVG
jgi:calcium-translocating P-type ATPase